MGARFLPFLCLPLFNLTWMRQLPEITLFSVFHKAAPLPKAPFVVPIQVGAATCAQRLDMLHDDTGRHISSKNGFYSELTALYWIWQNRERKEGDAWGLCHYRRYFTRQYHKLFFISKSRVYRSLHQEQLDAEVNQQLYRHLQQLLSSHDVVLQLPAYAHKEKGRVYTIDAAYRLQHDAPEWDITLDTITRLYPEYEISIPVFKQEQRLSYYNMMIARWPVWDAYLEWLFRILFAVEAALGNKATPRLFGYLSERLLNLYVLHNGLRPAYTTIALFEK